MHYSLLLPVTAAFSAKRTTNRADGLSISPLCHPHHACSRSCVPPERGLPIPNNHTPSFSRGRLRCLFPHLVLFRVDAAWPRLGRAFRTAPVSRQTNPNPVWHSPRFHSRPATLLRPPFCPFRRFRLVSSRCRSSEGRNKPKTAERGKNEIRRSQHTNQRGRGFPRCSIGVRSQ